MIKYAFKYSYSHPDGKYVRTLMRGMYKTLRKGGLSRATAKSYMISYGTIVFNSEIYRTLHG